VSEDVTLYVGAPLWGQKSWVGNFFPAGTKPNAFLRVYSRRLNTVEGNTTFYALPSAETIARWRDETPAGFRFCLKVPQTISHFKRLLGCEAETAAFIERLRMLADRCGPCFLQLPPGFGATHLHRLRDWLERWDRALPLAVEPRHANFFGLAEAEFNALLQHYGVTCCVFDTAALFSATPADAATREAQRRKPRFPTRFARGERFAFVRFVGHPDVAQNARWLAPWAERVANWLNQGVDVFFFTHHPDDTHAPKLAQMLQDQVGALTPLSARGGERADSQMTLW